MGRKAVRQGQAAGCGCLGFMGLLFIAFCNAGSGGGGWPPSTLPTHPSSSPRSSPPLPSPPLADTIVSERRYGLYVGDTLHVRAAPNKDAPIVRTLGRGDYVVMGPTDANGWARVYRGASPLGYTHQASDVVQSTEPPAEPDSTRSRPGAATRGYIRGPRGGCYYINSSDHKQYVDRSLCN